MELTSVQNVKKYLRLPSATNADDGLLQLLVDGANDAIASAISRNLLSDQYTETRNGTGTNRLMLANYPVTAVGSLAIVAPLPFGAATPPSSPLTLGRDFVFTSSSVQLLCGVFPRGVANVAIEYTAGFATLPADIVHAATKWAALRYREMERLGQKSKTLQGETVSFDLSELSPDMLAIVSRYQSVIPVVAAPTGLV